MAIVPYSVYQGFSVANARDTIYLKPAHLHAIYVSNANTSVRFFQLWDRNAALTGGEVGTGPTPYGNAVPASTATQLRVISFLVPAGTAAQPTVLELGDEWFSPGTRFDLGLTWGFSTAAQTYTAGTAGDHTVTLHWRAAG